MTVLWTMAQLVVQESVDIDRPADIVWRQFGDVAHHAATSLHRGVTFEVTHDDGTDCRYRQTTRLGPLKLRQDFTLHRADGEPLVNRIVKGQFHGGSITFTVHPHVDMTRVDAELSAPLPGLQWLVVPMLKRSVRKALAAALLEDKADLESGTYA